MTAITYKLTVLQKILCFKDKYEAFNWAVLEVDGHNIRAFVDSVLEAGKIHEKPTVIIAHVIPGKGVSFMENNFLWHGNPPDSVDIPGSPPKGEQAKKALEEIMAVYGKIEK